MQLLFILTACPSGRYGGGCLGVCSCEQGTCDRQDGHCTCYSGWTGKYCDQRMFYATLLCFVLINVLDPINLFKLATFLCTSQDGTWISWSFSNLIIWGQRWWVFFYISEILGHHYFNFSFTMQTAITKYQILAFMQSIIR